jgi:tetratricopeptide (TPR) repeat protein
MRKGAPPERLGFTGGPEGDIPLTTVGSARGEARRADPERTTHWACPGGVQMKTHDTENPQCEKLRRFVDLARVYRGWNRGELSAALGRDPSKLVPESGNPKLDLLVGLAEAIDWQVGDLAESVWHDSSHDAEVTDNTDTLRLEARNAHLEGRYEDLQAIARRMRAIAATPEERARACYAEFLSWDGVGRYSRALECIQEALTERTISPGLQVILETNLASAHYSIWHLVEARAVAADLIERLENQPIETIIDRTNLAYAYYVSGNTSRRMIEKGCPRIDMRIKEARANLRRAIELYTDADTNEINPNHAGIANTCIGALIEVDAADGSISPHAAIERIAAGLDAAVDPTKMPVGDWLESWGWWSIFGCNIALRSLNDPHLHHYMAVFTNKAIEIADRLGNWSMRERAFTMENFRRRRVTDSTGFQPDWVLDNDDIRVITGTMGRFPGFRETGWNILEKARVFDNS